METPRGSIIITSIREQENGCFIYMTEYDEAMNEISSNVYSIEKQKTVLTYFHYFIILYFCIEILNSIPANLEKAVCNNVLMTETEWIQRRR